MTETEINKTGTDMKEINALEEARKEINRIDGEMARLFEERMECAAVIAGYKKENGLPVRDKERERELLKRNTAYLRNQTLRPYYMDFLEKMIALSCARQETLIYNKKSGPENRKEATIENGAGAWTEAGKETEKEIRKETGKEIRKETGTGIGEEVLE